jgi:hypothetical protein
MTVFTGKTRTHEHPGTRPPPRAKTSFAGPLLNRQEAKLGAPKHPRLIWETERAAVRMPISREQERLAEELGDTTRPLHARARLAIDHLEQGDFASYAELAEITERSPDAASGRPERRKVVVDHRVLSPMVIGLGDFGR